MFPNPVIACLLVLLALGGVAWFAKAGSNRWNWHPELPRKLIHVGMGLICLSFPWIFDHPLPVQILALVAAASLATVRFVPALRSTIGTVLHDVSRRSVGELLFPIAVGTLFTVAHQTPVLYLVPLLLLTVADAAGALMGIRFGRIHYDTGDGRKSVEGSLSFLFLAFLCAYLPLLVGTDTGNTECILIALILALLTMIAEAISARGLDNFVIPVAGHFLLRILIEFPASTLAWRLVVLVVLLLLVVVAHRWSSLHGSGLLAAVFLGYGCFALGDWRFVLPPLALFLSHLFTTHRLRTATRLTHGVDSVASLAVSSLPWLLLKAAGVLEPEVALLAFACGFSTHLAIMHCRTQRWCGNPPGLALAVSKGVFLAALPVILIESTPYFGSADVLLNFLLVLFAFLVITALATAALTLLRQHLDKDDSAFLFVEAGFSFAAALTMLGILELSLYKALAHAL